MKISTHSISADSHLLALLGDELIGNDKLAIFELVKNAYDADATHVVVELKLSGKDSAFRIKDNGTGMTKATITDSWMRLATGQKRGVLRAPSKIFQRMPLGEKGVGRLAVQKLGAKLRLVTRAAESPEFLIEIDWKPLMESTSDLLRLQFNLQELEEPKEFIDDTHGTLIEITDLNRIVWEKKDLRGLKRLIESLKSPFQNVSDFNVDLRVPGREEDINDLLDAHDILNRAVWIYKFRIESRGEFEWSYEFRPPSALEKRLAGRIRKSGTIDDKKLLGIKLAAADQTIRQLADRSTLHIGEGDLEGIGAISGALYVFDRRRESLEQGTFQQMRTYLDEQTGVRVYRDGVRVFNYGEPEDDWLSLNARRINRPAERMGTNSVIGAVHISLGRSTELKEKTNREGFDESTVFLRFRWIVQSIVANLDKFRGPDREKLDAVIAGTALEKKASTKKPFDVVVEEIRETLQKNKLEGKLAKQIDYIEKEYRQMRDILSGSGLAGLNVALIFHEIEREVVALRKAIEESQSYKSLRERAGHVVGLLDAVSGLLRQSQRRSGSIKQLLGRVHTLNAARFEHHHIVFSCPVLTGEDKDFEINGPLNLFLAAINNIVDNAMHWSRARSELEPSETPPAIVIRTFPNWYKDGNALVIADNGAGFRIDPEDAIRPFVTTKPGGMGLGLYYTNLVMESTGGELLIAGEEEFELGPSYAGGIVALKFKKA